MYAEPISSSKAIGIELKIFLDQVEENIPLEDYDKIIIERHDTGEAKTVRYIHRPKREKVIQVRYDFLSGKYLLQYLINSKIKRESQTYKLGESIENEFYSLQNFGMGKFIENRDVPTYY